MAENPLDPPLYQRDIRVAPRYLLLHELPESIVDPQICDLCGGAVIEATKQRHTEWHDTVIRALANALAPGSLFGGPRG